MTAFYSETVKLTAARKIAALLQMSEQQLFGQALPAALPIDDEAPQAHLASESTSQQPLGLASWGGLNSQANPITRSEVLHELAQPPEHVDEDAPVLAQPVVLEVDKARALSVEDQSLAQPELTPQAQSPEATTLEPAATETAPASASGHYFLKILALFVVALAAAALLKQNAVEEKPAMPAAESPAAPEPPPVMPPSLAEPAAQPAAAPAVMETKSITESKPATTEPKPISAETKPAAAPTKPAEPQSP